MILEPIAIFFVHPVWRCDMRNEQCRIVGLTYMPLVSRTIGQFYHFRMKGRTIEIEASRAADHRSPDAGIRTVDVCKYFQYNGNAQGHSTS